MIIFSTPTGAKIEYQPAPRRQGSLGLLIIDDSSPPTHLTWGITRGVLIRMGVRCVLAALKR